MSQTSTSKISLPVCQHTPQPYSGPSRSEVLAMRQQYLSPGLLTYYKDPLMVVEGHMQYLFDEAGKQYLDAFAGIVTVSVGHCHPKVVQRVQEQVGRLQHTTTIYLHPTIAQYGKLMAEHMPPGSDLSKTYFTNSGSEANELAVLSAREFTGNHEIITLRNAYHGGTQATMSLTAHGNWKFKSVVPTGIKHATPGYCYRCPYGLEYPSCDVKCATDVEDLVGGAGEGRLGPAGHADDARADLAGDREHDVDLLGLAAVREREHEIDRSQPPEVAVQGLGRVQEERRSPGAGEGRGDLLADHAGLAHPRHDDLALARPNELGRPGEGRVEAGLEARDRVRLEPHDLARRGQEAALGRGVEGQGLAGAMAARGAVGIGRFVQGRRVGLAGRDSRCATGLDHGITSGRVTDGRESASRPGITAPAGLRWADEAPL